MKTYAILAAIASATTYPELEASTGMSQPCLRAFVFHLVSRGFIVKTRACRLRPSVFTITESGRAYLDGKIQRRRRVIKVEAVIAARPALEAVWPSVTVADRLGFEPFEYCERS